VPRFVATRPDTGLLSLPWDVPLEDWPEDQLVALPRGISRHVVRFVRVNGTVYAIKEVLEHLALHEYRLLRDLERLESPSVEPVGVITDRLDRNGEPIDSILITRHLQFSLPYRALFSSTLRPDTVNRLIDALVALIVRLHLLGFFWGDCSLSNTLFRRDAGAFAAYLVDAETGELH
jgi:Lipopolysaccharide kinase (Kdo/WaaP) family